MFSHRLAEPEVEHVGQRTVVVAADAHRPGLSLVPQLHAVQDQAVGGAYARLDLGR